MQRFRKGQQFKPPSAAEHSAHADAAAAHRRAPSQPQDLAPVGQAVFVLTPAGGIDARDGTTISSALCTRLIETLSASGTLTWVQTDEQYRVYNFAEDAVAGNSYIETGLTSCGTRYAAAANNTGYKPWCAFSLDAAMGTDDEWVHATIEEQFGQGTSHTTTAIILHNMETQDGSYEYYGDSGDMGYAFFDRYEEDTAGDYGTAGATVAHWRCNPIECP